MPEQINSFEKGLNQDSPLERQPTSTYRYALNAVDISREGDQFKIISEKGNILFSDTALSVDYLCIGSDTLNTDIILVFTNNTNTIIGIVDVTGVFTIKVNTALLELTKDKPVQIESRILFNGHRCIYMSGEPIRAIDLDNPVFDNGNSKLFADIDLPEITNLTVLDGTSGSLIAGVYQFVARYLEEDLSTTTFGDVSNPIPIVGELKSVGRNQYDGEAVDTPVLNKNITITISNIDTSKKFIELVAIWYTGLGQVINIKSFIKLPITSSTIEYTFTGAETLVDVSLDSIVLPPTVYSGAKTLAQKDNRLFLGNLKQKAANNNLQLIANNIAVTYDIAVQEYQESVSNYFDDYKEPVNTFNGKTYMREEVYAFAFRVVYKDGSKSFAYHIPAIAPDTTWVDADNYATNYSNGFLPTVNNINQKFYPSDFQTQAFTVIGDSVNNYTNKKLGTFISTETYELGKNYPTNGLSDGAGNIYVRHHVIPPLDVEPHYTSVDNKQYIRKIRLRFSLPDFSLLSVADRNDIVSYEILRGDRVLKERTIISQGLHQKMVTYAVNLNNSINGDKYITHSPLFGNGELVAYGVVDNAASGWMIGGGVGGKGPIAPIPTTSFILEPNHYVNDTIFSFTNRYYSYYSPDWILGNIPQIGNSIKEKLKIKGDIGNTNTNVGQNFGSDLTPSNINDWWLLQFCNYSYLDNSYKLNNKFTLNNNPQLIQSGNTQFTTTVNNGGPIVWGDFNTPYYLFGLQGYSNTPKLFQDGAYTVFNLTVKEEIGDDVYDGFCTPANNHARSVVNICDYKKTVYNINSTEYIPIVSKKVDYIGDISVYNGDVFISKFSFKTGFNFDVSVYGDFDDGSISRQYYDVKTFERSTNPRYSLRGIPLLALSYFFVESTVNCNYRHDTGPKYYPKEQDPSQVLHVSPLNGHSTGYNFLYSKNNNVKPAVPAPLGSVSVGDYTNRIAYSEQAFDSEQQDTYRKFKALSYHDIPKNKGVIWNLFVNNSTLYAHTPKTLWKTSVNERSAVQNAYDGNAILLGNGGLFPIPSQEMLTIDGGYAGTISQWGGVNTPAGYIFPDILQGKYFLLGNGLQDINSGMSRYFINLKDGLIANDGTYVDNPFYTKGITIAYDSRHNRVITTSKNDTTFTLSYSLEAKCWRSFHSYTPEVYISQDNELYSINSSTKLYKHNSGDYLKFYENTYDFKLSLVMGQPNTPIVLDNFVIKQVITNIDNVYVHQRTFNKIRVYNDKQNTDYIDVLCSNNYNTLPTNNQLLVTEKNNEFRYTIPKNAVINDSIDKFNSLNLVTTLDLDNPLRLYRDRMKGNYNIVELIYTPIIEENNKFTINYIKSSYRINQV